MRRYPYPVSERRGRFDSRVGDFLFLTKHKEVVVHVGAHLAEEAKEYEYHGCQVLWIEADPTLVEVIQQQGVPQNQLVVQGLLTDSIGETRTLYEMGQKGAHSTVLQPIRSTDVSSTRMLKSTTLDQVLSSRSVSEVDLLVMDIQGAELMALRGSLETLKKTRMVFLEASTRDIYYKGTPRLHELDDFFCALGFSRVMTVLHGQNGDEGNVVFAANKLSIREILRLKFAGIFFGKYATYRLLRHRVGNNVRKFVGQLNSNSQT